MYDQQRGLYIAHCTEGDLSIVGKMANRHGLIAGATGTGKTVTLQVMAETFAQAGVPCFMADMKGDLSGISRPGAMSGFIEKRLSQFGIDTPQFQACPVRFYDVYGEQGHPIRTTVSQMGPQLLSRLLGLNETQDGVLNIVFRVADDRGLLILDMKDLRSMLDHVVQNAKEYSAQYGNISGATVSAIQRALLQLENQGANQFFGEPAFDIRDLLQTDPQGRGVLSVLAAEKLMLQPKLYSTFLLWLMTELYSTLPEVGDLDMPKLIFFFDEAHMLFDDTSKAMVDKVEQVIRLIRSKGVGIYFVTQNPSDIPDSILGQLGNRVQHALRAYAPKDQKAVKTAADTMRPNPAFKTDEAITTLETGEALVSFLDEKGAPTVVQRANILFPLSQIGAITPEERAVAIKQSSIYGKYDTPIDSESAYEILMREREALQTVEEEKTVPAAKEPKAKEEKPAKKSSGIGSKVLKGIITAVTATLATAAGTAVSDKISGKKTKSRTSTGQKIVKNTTSAATRTITRELTRSIFGNLLK
jgi:DNA helicase HerA-like ATPase